MVLMVRKNLIIKSILFFIGRARNLVIQHSRCKLIGVVADAK